jgi:imidazolonepropionase
VPEGGDRESFVAEAVGQWVPRAAELGLARSVDAFVEPGYFTPGDARALAESARRHGLGVRLHVDQLSPGHGAELAAEIGADSADHLEQTTPEGIAALARSATVPILLPGSVLGLGLSRYPDARAMIDAGLPVALATDFNPGSSPTISQTTVMALAVRAMRMTPEEAFVAATRHAAWSLDLADRGCLAPGTRADLVVWDAADYRELACWFGQWLAREVWIAGRPVYRRPAVGT